MLMAMKEELQPMTLDHLIESEDGRDRPSCNWSSQRCASATRWYPLVTEPQQEVRISTTLRSYRVPHYMPMVPQVVTRGVRRTKVTAYRPMLRGYILIPDDGLDPLARLTHPLPVHGFLRFGEHQAVVADVDVRRLRNCEEELAKPKPFQSIWSVGEVVRIGEGPFMGLNATITDLANGRRITVEVPFMKRAVSASMDPDHLEKL